MKKFLSLLLTLTMVLSLAVVPARADGEESLVVSDYEISANPSAVTKGGTVTINVSSGTVTYNGVEVSPTEVTYSWSYDSTKFTAPSAQNPTQSTLALVANHAGENLQVSCTVTAKYTPEGADAHEIAASQPAISTAVTVNDSILDSDISAVSFKTRSYAYASNTATVYYDAAEAASDLAAKANWGVNASGVTVDAVSVTGDGDTKSVALTLKKTGCEDKIVTVSAVKLTAPSITATPSTNAKTGTKVVLALTGAMSDNTKITWTYKAADAAANVSATPFTPSKNTSTGSYEWLLPDTLQTKTYTITCLLSESGAENTAVSNTTTVGVVKDENKLTYTSTVSAARGSTVNLRLTFTDKDGNKIDDALSNVAWEIKSGTGATLGIKKVSDDGKTASNTLTVNSNSTASSYTVTATFNVGGKDYTATFTVRVNALTATLSSSVQNGGNVPLYTTGTSNYYNSLATIAQNAIYRQLGKNVSVTFASVSQTSSTKGTLSSTASNGYFIYNAPKSYFGSDTLTITARASDGNTYYVTLTIPVTPILNTSFESVNAELVSTTSSTYGSYRVYFPASHARFYVLNTTGTAPSDWTSVSLGSSYSSSTPYTLNINSSNYNNGQVTLYVVAQRYTSGSSTEYYAGPLTVYLQSNDIEYTGVAGSTVNFQHSSFTAFLNAMNVSTSTDYYEFQDVTFTYFNSTTQGTLYYGSTAMTSGTYNSSSYFNSATKITNLDNVSFAIKSTIPSTIKTISIPFQLHAKQYRSGTYSSTFVRDVTFSGRVVISVAREDVVINVAAGDAVKLDATAFLTYLRNSSTSYRNANIDYVTFSQNLSVSSSSSAYVNGALYTYYTNSYSFGNPVTSTDRFYYNPTTYNVNRLSDVAFRANAYASAGTTVYIPFTIKLLNSNATVTGTLAAKIANAVNFYDVAPGAYYYDAVKWAVGAGVTKGTGNNMFSPAKSCTRAEIVTFLWRAAKSPAPKSYSNPFTDVYSGMGSDFYNAILWAVGEGITTGTTTSKFSPNDTCTRGQIVTFLHRYLKTPSGYYSNPFKDVKSGYYCYNAVIWAYGSGVAKGSSATTFSPDATCTRGDAVTFLYRALVK